MTPRRGLWTTFLAVMVAGAALAACQTAPGGVSAPDAAPNAVEDAQDAERPVDGLSDASAHGDYSASESAAEAPPPSSRTRGLRRREAAQRAPADTMGVIAAPSISSAEEAAAGRGSVRGFGGLSGRASGVRPAATIDRENGLVHVLFGTNRAEQADRAGDTPGKRLTEGRSSQLKYGSLRVSIPPKHRTGQVERPFQLQTMFGSVSFGAEDARKHIVVSDGAFLSPEAFAQLAARLQAGSERFEDQALIFVHGFNNTFETAAYRTAQIVWDLQFDGAAYFYSWPSRGDLNRQGYQYDRESVLQSREAFREFLEHVATTSRAKRVHVVAHSMGALLTMETLRDINRDLAPSRPLFGEIVLAAPDIDRDVFRQLSAAIEGVADSATLYASSKDKALAVAERWAAGPRAGDVPAQGPVIAPGFDTVDASDVSLGLLWTADHARFAEASALIDDLDELLRQGLRPPHERTPLLQQVIAPQGPYWRFAAPQ